MITSRSEWGVVNSHEVCIVNIEWLPQAGCIADGDKFLFVDRTFSRDQFDPLIV